MGNGAGINAAAPIPHELQVAGPAGSVFIQDSRCWHCQVAMGRKLIFVPTVLLCMEDP